MKSLLLLRHAKSSWSDSALGDFDRPLNDRGKIAAPRMASYMQSQGLAPDLVLCSSAVRAEQTWDLVDRVLGCATPVKRLRNLYLAPPSRLLEVARSQADAVDRLLVVAHNPGLAQLAMALAGPDSDPEAKAALAAKFPTAALAAFTFDCSRWADLEPGRGRLVAFVTPRSLA